MTAILAGVGSRQRPQAQAARQVAAPAVSTLGAGRCPRPGGRILPASNTPHGWPRPLELGREASPRDKTTAAASSGRALAGLVDLLNKAGGPGEVAGATAALTRAPPDIRPLSSLIRATYEVVATNSPLMRKQELDLSLVTSLAEPLFFTPGATKISFFDTKCLEWSDGLVGGRAARLAMASHLQLHDTWMETRASHFHLDMNDRTQPPAVLDFGGPGQPPPSPERVNIIFFDGHHLVSEWKGFVTVAKRSADVTLSSLENKLDHANFLVGEWKVQGGGWQGTAHCEPTLGGDWLCLKTYMEHDKLGVYNAHCLIGEIAGKSVCQKYFEGGSTFFGVLQDDSVANSVCWIGERRVPGQAPVQQRTTYIRRGGGAMQILGAIQGPDGAWVTIADLQAQRR